MSDAEGDAAWESALIQFDIQRDGLFLNETRQEDVHGLLANTPAPAPGLFSTE